MNLPQNTRRPQRRRSALPALFVGVIAVVIAMAGCARKEEAVHLPPAQRSNQASQQQMPPAQMDYIRSQQRGGGAPSSPR